MMRCVLLVAATALTSVAATQENPMCSDPAAPEARVDCYPGDGFTEQGCLARGCCFSSSLDGLEGQPECFFPPGFGYDASNVQQTDAGWSATLTRTSSSPASPYGGDIPVVQMSLTYESDTSLRLRIAPADSTRWEVPIPTPGPPSSPPSNPIYNVTLETQSFALIVTRRESGTVVFDMRLGPIIFSDQFIQMSTGLPSNNVYGLGEHVSPLLLSTNWPSIPIWSRDQGTPEGYDNLYGMHPFLMALEPSTGSATGYMLLNSNAQEWALAPAPSATFRTIGGIIDFRIFLSAPGTGPDNVIQQFTEVIGRPYLVPYWSLGFHLCRWGYESVNRTRAVWQAMTAAGIPQDTQWNDIDYMNKHLDFTYDPVAFEGLPEFVEELHSNGQHYIPIIDPGIANTQPEGSYPAYDAGTKADVWCKDSTGKAWWGDVWPGSCNFPDWTAPNTASYWQDQLQGYYNMVQYDSLWIDMNDAPAIVGDSEACGSNSINNPPFVPRNLADGNINTKTMCADAQLSAGKNYDLHGLYGHGEIIATKNALDVIRNKRSIVISRSTFMGSGTHGSHWLGDNDATWADLYLSIPGMLNFNMFGIPLVGADICGFGGTTTQELCTRWHQVGAFSPFSRNHNTKGAPAQDPTAFGSATATIVKDVLMIRYTLLPHLYTLFFDSHINGSTVMRPLFFEFPLDANTYAIDRQFLWGDSFLVTPVLTQGATSVVGYFPAGDWYSYYTGEYVKQASSSGTNVTLDAPINFIPLHVRGGAVLPLQTPATTTTAARALPYGLLIALSQQTQRAQGHMVIDDGESLTTVADSAFLDILFAVSGNTLTNHISGNWLPPSDLPQLGYTRVFGVANPVSSVTVNGEAHKDFTFDKTNNVLEITSINVPVNSSFSISWE